MKDLSQIEFEGVHYPVSYEKSGSIFYAIALTSAGEIKRYGKDQEEAYDALDRALYQELKWTGPGGGNTNA